MIMDINKLTLYECSEIIQSVENLADSQEGVVTDAQMELLVKAQTTSLAKLEKLANYVRHLELFQDMSKVEEDRLFARRKAAANRVESIKRFLFPYLNEHGPVTVGLHRFSVRPSEGVVLADNFKNLQYGEIRSEYVPDKKKIGKDIKDGIAVEGARIEKRQNVQIK
jgi:hypothetical protein